MVIYKHSILTLTLCFLSLFFGCAKNGIEGTVQYFGNNKPASGVKIEAKADTDIKEEQSKASLTATSDSNGHFNIKSLLPNKPYIIKSADPNFDSTIATVVAPEKGTKIIREPIIVCPLPPSDGIWVYDTSYKRLKQIEYKRVQVRKHFYDIHGSVSDEDSQKAPTLRRNGLLILRGDRVLRIGQLFKVPHKILSEHYDFGAEKRIVIEEGWYLNTSDFYVNPHGIVNAKIHKLPNFQESAFKSAREWAISLNMFASGLYILITEGEDWYYWYYNLERGFLIKLE